MKEFLKNIIKLSPIPFTKNHKYDLETKKIIARTRKNFNSIDVGCHKGEILDLFLKHSPDGVHYGIEALPDFYKKLEEKYKDNRNCKILNIAASDEAKTIEFNHVVTNPAYSGMLKRDYDNDNEKDEKIQVLAERLDDKIPADVRIDIIKIDVEGAELQVLKGAKKIIQRHKPIVIFEHGLGASDHYGTTPEMIMAFFTDADMKISNLDSFLKEGKTLSEEAFKDQYYKKLNYYFVAHK